MRRLQYAVQNDVMSHIADQSHVHTGIPSSYEQHFLSLGLGPTVSGLGATSRSINPQTNRVGWNEINISVMVSSL